MSGHYIKVPAVLTVFLAEETAAQMVSETVEDKAHAAVHAAENMIDALGANLGAVGAFTINPDCRAITVQTADEHLAEIMAMADGAFGDMLEQLIRQAQA